MKLTVSLIVFSFHSLPSISETTRIPARTIEVRRATASVIVFRESRSRLSTSRMEPRGIFPSLAAIKKAASAPSVAFLPLKAEIPRSDSAKSSSKTCPFS